jgi:2'-5' RNA ligase
MAQIAVDVVLIPSDQMTNMAIEANRELLKNNPDKIILDRYKCLPHISLAMGCIDQRKINDIEKILCKITADFSVGLLNIVNIHTHTNITGEKGSVLQIENTNRIQSLHEKVMTSMKPYFSYDVTADMLLSDGFVGESTMQWIKNFPEESGYGNYFPHITIGYGEIKLDFLPVRFNISKIALCHLGNHCTCRKVLTAAELTG